MEKRVHAPLTPWRCHRSPCLIFQLMLSRTYHRNNEEHRTRILSDSYNTIAVLDADILEIEDRSSSWRKRRDRSPSRTRMNRITVDQRKNGILGPRFHSAILHQRDVGDPLWNFVLRPQSKNDAWFLGAVKLMQEKKEFRTCGSVEPSCSFFFFRCVKMWGRKMRCSGRTQRLI